MRVLVLILLCMFIVLPQAVAQSGADKAELPTMGEGPEGRFTKEQAQIIALDRVPGEVTQIDGYWQNDRFYFAYQIVVPDGSIYEVEVKANIGKIHRIEIESLAAGAKLPHVLVSENMVKSFALDHVFRKTRGKRSPKIVSSEIAVFQRQPVYRMIVKKSAKLYELIYSAESSDFIKMEALD